MAVQRSVFVPVFILGLFALQVPPTTCQQQHRDSQRGCLSLRFGRGVESTHECVLNQSSGHVYTTYIMTEHPLPTFCCQNRLTNVSLKVTGNCTLQLSLWKTRVSALHLQAISSELHLNSQVGWTQVSLDVTQLQFTMDNDRSGLFHEVLHNARRTKAQGHDHLHIGISVSEGSGPCSLKALPSPGKPLIMTYHHNRTLQPRVINTVANRTQSQMVPQLAFTFEHTDKCTSQTTMCNASSYCEVLHTAEKCTLYTLDEGVGDGSGFENSDYRCGTLSSAIDLSAPRQTPIVFRVPCTRDNEPSERVPVPTSPPPSCTDSTCTVTDTTSKSTLAFLISLILILLLATALSTTAAITFWKKLQHQKMHPDLEKEEGEKVPVVTTTKLIPTVCISSPEEDCLAARKTCENGTLPAIPLPPEKSTVESDYADPVLELDPEDCVTSDDDITSNHGNDVEGGGLGLPTRLARLRSKDEDGYNIPFETLAAIRQGSVRRKRGVVVSESEGRDLYADIDQVMQEINDVEPGADTRSLSMVSWQPSSHDRSPRTSNTEMPRSMSLPVTGHSLVARPCHLPPSPIYAMIDLSRKSSRRCSNFLTDGTELEESDV